MRNVRNGNEEIKIESKNNYVKIVRIVMIVAIIIAIISLIKWKDYRDKAHDIGYVSYRDDDYEEKSELRSHYYDMEEACMFISIGTGAIGIIALGLYIYSSKMKIVVTDKRVYGRTSFGREVNLPFDSISAVAKGMLKGIAVATSSGKIKFVFISNRDKIYSTISDLLLDRQNNTETINNVSISNAEEIKKYKDLLDSGIITQEEFDKKKRELLGL